MKNEKSLKKIWRQLKFKKLNTLKYKPTVPSHTNSQENDATQDRPRKLLYSDIIKRKPSESSINKKSNELQVPNKPTDTIQQLGTLNSKKKGKSLTRCKSNTKQNKSSYKQLKEEVKILKNNNKAETKKKNTDTFTSTETPKQNSKNVQMASDSQGCQQQNMEIIQVIRFIKETMQIST